LSRRGHEPGQLIAWVAARVAPHKRIRAVRLVREIPRTPSGKILRRLPVEADRAELAGAGPNADGGTTETCN
jgi:acyl-coenzyme A synthetase/AMP-(fatty) acid ligase